MNKKTRVAVSEAAKILSMNPQSLRIAMQKEKIPIGYAIKKSNRWSYYIFRNLLEEYVGGSNL